MPTHRVIVDMVSSFRPLYRWRIWDIDARCDVTTGLPMVMSGQRFRSSREALAEGTAVLRSLKRWECHCYA